MKVRDIEGVTVRDGFTVDPRVLKVEDGFNVRDYTAASTKEHIDELCESIKYAGVLEPITVRLMGEDLFVVSGHCRHRATMQAIEQGAEISKVPIILENRGVNEVDRTAQLMVHNSGLSLSHLEQGVIMKRLLAFGLSDAEIASKVSKSITHVKNVIKLMEGPQPVLDMVKEGKVNGTLATHTVLEHGDKAADILAEGYSVATKMGKKKVTAKALQEVTGEPKEKRYNHTDAKAMVDAFKEILASEDISSIHKISTNILESFGEMEGQ